MTQRNGERRQRGLEIGATIIILAIPMALVAAWDPPGDRPDAAPTRVEQQFPPGSAVERRVARTPPPGKGSRAEERSRGKQSRLASPAATPAP